MKSYNPINLNRLELQNFRIQNLAAFPSSPLAGMVFFHTIDLTYYGYNGSSWINLGQQLTANDIVNFINGSILKIDDKNLSDNVNNAISQMHSHNNKSILDSTTASYTAAEKTKLSGIENNADITDSDNIGISINSTIAKTTMVDADTIPILNSAGSNSLSKITWSNIKSALKTYFDTLYNKYVHPNHTGDVISSGDGTTTISNNVVTNAKLADVSTNTIKGRVSSGTGDPEDLTASQVKTILSLSNVENKSSATIRNEITKANITSGLGYTPVKSDGVILEVKSGTLANRPAATGSGLLYFDSDGKIWRDISNGVWLQTGGQELPIATGTILGGIKVGANLSITEGGVLSANDNPANFIIKQELFTASSGQTQFVLTKGKYKPNTNTLFWYLNGQKQENNVLIETSPTTFTINGGVDEGSDIIIEYIELINASPFPYHSSEHLSDGVDPIPLAKSTKEGLMSKEDFNKLANISSNGDTTGNAATATKLKSARTISLTGDITGSTSTDFSGNVSIVSTKKNSGVTAGTYTKVTVDAKGDVISGASISASDIPTITSSRISDFNSTVRNNALNLMAIPTADLNLNNNKIVNLAEPVNGSDAVTKDYADNLRAGLLIKDPVRAATTVNITLSGLQTIDGVTLAANDRVLVKNQTDGKNNGIYLVSSSGWVRSTDADSSTEVKAGFCVWVNEGTENSDSRWVLTTNDPIVLGTTVLAFTKDFQASDIIAGNGLSKSGNTLSMAIPGALSPSTSNAATSSSHTHSITVSSESEAKAGTSANSFMTPLRVSQAINELQAIKSVDGRTGSVNLSSIYEPKNNNIQTHIGNTANPHGTTKSHVGLSNVENYSVATQAQAEAGILNSAYMTPLRVMQALNNFINTNSITKKFVADIGNGSDTEFIITHSFGTKDLTYGIEEVSTSEMVWVDMLKVDNNKIKLIFGVAPSISQFRLTLIG